VICPGCGGVLGRDCFNAQDCQAIAQDMARQQPYLSIAANQRDKREDESSRVAKLREALVLIAEHAALDYVNRKIAEAERYEIIACAALEADDYAAIQP
jgi:hypothetical protein